ncbi:four helix bundle protein [Patescibacteria group bacterium]|nr:four helix bundle protein [Patescibacteria group bacterium]
MNKASVKNYKDLIVWQKSMNLSVKIYELVKLLPEDESRNLISQLKRASVSIHSNIAEGYSMGGRNYKYFIQVAYASASEIESQLKLIKRLNLVNNSTLLDEINSILIEVLKMLSTMISNIKRKYGRNYRS